MRSTITLVLPLGESMLLRDEMMLYGPGRPRTTAFRDSDLCRSERFSERAGIVAQTIRESVRSRGLVNMATHE